MLRAVVLLLGVAAAVASSAAAPVPDTAPVTQEHIQDQLLDASSAGDVHRVHALVQQALQLDVAAEASAADAETEANPHRRRLAASATVVDGVLDEAGRSPLHLAAMGGHMVVLDFLAASGASVNEPDDAGDTPLLSCIREGVTSMVKPLIVRGADVNLANTLTGETPLAAAAAIGDVDVAELLLAKRATLDDGAVELLRQSTLCHPGPSRKYHRVRRACGLAVAHHPKTWDGPPVDYDALGIETPTHTPKPVASAPAAAPVSVPADGEAALDIDGVDDAVTPPSGAPGAK